MAGLFRGRREHRDARESLDELIAIVKRYVLQETVGPLKAIARSLALGAVGALLFAIGSVILVVGLLRALQNETGSLFTGSYSFAPYLIAPAAGVVLVGLASALALKTSTRRPGRTDR